MLRPASLRLCTVIVVGSFVAGLLAAPKPRPSVAVPPPTEAAATQPMARPAWPPIPKETLAAMYRTELGPLFKPELVPSYTRAHEWIEKYFETIKPAERKEIAKQIEATELPPGVIGRLCRIRTYWPDLAGGGVYYINEKTGVHPTRYFFGLPKEYDRTRAWPLVVKLPTAHAFLVEPPLTADQVTQAYVKWIKEELAAHPDAVVVMPLLNLDELWGPSYAGVNSVMLPIHHVASRANIDPARVYLIGHAMSGHAAWNLALHYTTYFAAFNPLAGGASADWQRVRLLNLRNVLPVVWHDADDPVIKVDTSRALVKALRTQKVDVDFDETKGIGHVPDAATAERAYGKLRARVRDLYPPAVTVQSNRPDTMYNRVDWLQVYQPVNPGKDHRVSFRHGSGTMVYTDNVHRLDGARKPNRIEVTANNVDAFRIYLNDQMADLTKPITVMVNGRPRFEGIVKQSVEELMKDQVFLGRGWRYYTAILDVEMTARPPIPAATKPATRTATTRPGP